MRTEADMIELILKIAEKDDRVRAVGMNGSRTNTKVPKDVFQDYDIVYIVTEMESFIRDHKWIDVFGERIIMQKPEEMSFFPPELGGRFSYLMQFTDGNRIDLLLVPFDEKDVYCKEDKLTIILMDKDNCLPSIPNPTDVDYWIKKPSTEFFDDCCIEFWWVSTYVAKGLWRKEILYAQEHLNNVRLMLIQMLEWQVGIETNFSVSVGKHGKYLECFLTEKSWQKLLSTYADGSYDGVWRALFSMCDLFDSTAMYVGKHLNYEYPYENEKSVITYLKHIQNLSPNATEIF
ncbi:aminoglycoside 6-adenylyltransferase [Peribacillus sp. TH27]|uniref:aminoglycoside 6-adenylyltransferase n=1 Tax=Peribacillus sp. TH27 TaxID=2798484 RepID=UPI0019144ADA|nr:aminoglycoside 6-adenylyltransferase [Peribacillus sp. TH27]MBK5458762.1 aminoglycoside 6-adenylyltransferase [Peribacillus sp. TH27]